MAGLFLNWFQNGIKLSPHMDKISQHINPKNYKIRSYDQMRNIIVNLGSMTSDNIYKSSPQLSRIQSS